MRAGAGSAGAGADSAPGRNAEKTGRDRILPIFDPNREKEGLLEPEEGFPPAEVTTFRCGQSQQNRFVRAFVTIRSRAHHANIEPVEGLHCLLKAV